MNDQETNNDYAQFLPQKNVIYLRGIIMLIMGVLVSAGSILAPGVFLLSQSNSWLPIAAIIIFFVGLLECFDAFISRKSNRFIINLQLAISDTVFGALILFSIDIDPNQAGLLITAFLITKGAFRAIGAKSGEFPNSKSTTIGGFISIFFGLLIWVLWPSAPVTLLSICLSLEIALRGWALLSFSSWLKLIETNQQ